MDIHKFKVNKFISIICFALVMLLSINTLSFAGSRGPSPSTDHTDKTTGFGGFEKSSQPGGFKGENIRINYNFYGGIVAYGAYRDLTNVSIDAFAKNMKWDLAGLTYYHPKDELRARGKLYGTFMTLSECHQHLAADTGIGSADDYGNGNIRVGDNGLFATIIMAIDLNGAGSHIGEHFLGDDLTLGYEYPGGNQTPTPDLGAILSQPGQGLVNWNGVTMIGYYTLNNYAGKVSGIPFVEGFGPGETVGDDDDDDDDDLVHSTTAFGEYVKFFPESSDWTNDPYYVTATLEMPEHATLSSDMASLGVTNCCCLAGSTTSHTHNRTTQSPCPTGRAGVDHVCSAEGGLGHIISTYWGPDTHDEIWNVNVAEGVWMKQTRKVKNPHYTYEKCTVEETYSISINYTPLWGQDRTYECQICGGRDLRTKIGNHTCYNFRSVPYDYGTAGGVEKQVTYMDIDGVSAPGAGGESAKFLINQVGSHKVTVQFAIKAHNIWVTNALGAFNLTTYSRPVSDEHQTWVMSPSNWRGVNATAQTYKFDNVNPVVTVSTSGFAEAGSQTFTGPATVNGTWTNQSMTFDIKAYDANSGLNESASYIEAWSAEGQCLTGEDTFGTFHFRQALSSNSRVTIPFPSSGIYTVKIHVEDKANQGAHAEYVTGGERDDDGVPNSYDIIYNVKEDQIAPQIKYAYPKSKMIYNPNKQRFETSASTKPYFWITTTDDDNWHGITSGLKEAKYLLTNVLQDGSAAKDYGTPFDGESWQKIMINDKYLRQGKDVYLLIYAVDNVGNVSTTCNIVASKSEMRDETAGTPAENAWVGPYHGTIAADENNRVINAGHVYINRSNGHHRHRRKSGSGGGGGGGGGTIEILEEDDAPLEITKVYDTKWATGNASSIISFNNRADSSTFAVYRNKANDMIGLGYRVNFCYHLIGYGSDVGDTTTIWLAVYGKNGNKYEKLDCYLEGSSTPIPESDPIFKRTFTRDASALPVDNMTAETENSMALNSFKWYLEDVKREDGTQLDDEFVCYFNFSLPATVKFKYHGTNKLYTGSEVVIRVNPISSKADSIDPGHIIDYTLGNDYQIVWPEVGNGSEFYGSHKIVPLNGDDTQYVGEAFWYDIDNTAMTDITGQKSH